MTEGLISTKNIPLNGIINYFLIVKQCSVQNKHADLKKHTGWNFAQNTKKRVQGWVKTGNFIHKKRYFIYSLTSKIFPF